MIPAPAGRAGAGWLWPWEWLRRFLSESHVAHATPEGLEHKGRASCHQLGGGPRWSALRAGLCSCLQTACQVTCCLAWRVTPRYSPFQPKPVEVQVITHHMQRYAVWFGGSMLASTVSPFLDCSVFSFPRSLLSLNKCCPVKVK